MKVEFFVEVAHGVEVMLETDNRNFRELCKFYDAKKISGSF